MTAVRVAIGLILAMTRSALAQPLAAGDIAVASRTYGTVFGISRATGQISLLSGRDLGVTNPTGIGTGPQITGSQVDLAPFSSSAILARVSNSATFVAIDLATANRTLLTSAPSLWANGGAMIRADSDSYFVLGDAFNSGITGNGRLLKYTFSSGATTLLSGNAVGDGPVMHRPRSLAVLDSQTVLVCEYGPLNSLPGCVIYKVDLSTGSRAVLSTLTDTLTPRYSVTGGVVSTTTSIVPARGSGPTTDSLVRGIAVLGGRIFVCGSLAGSAVPFIMEIDPISGNRTLRGGQAWNPGRVRLSIPFGAGSTTTLPDSPSALTPATDHTLVMVAAFGPNRVWEYDIDTNVVSVLADLDANIIVPYRADAQFTGLCVVETPCGSCTPCDVDGNRDGSLDQGDVSFYIDVIAGGNNYTNVDPDINHDGNLDAADIDAVINVIAGGNCP